MSASEELERLAAKYATEAIELDRHGSKGLAIAKYQRAIELLLKLCSLYPNSSQNKVYSDLAESYEKRIRELQEQSLQQNSIDQEATTKIMGFNQFVLTEKPNVKWSDIADLKEAKKVIEESITYPVKRPDLFPLGWPRGILFFGPPGCGKTLLAAAIATEINANFYCVDAASITSKWLGESEKNVARLFESAREASMNGQPAIIFIDEVDSLIGIRSDEIGGEVRMRNQFLKEMDSIVDKNKKVHVYLIGATNKPWALDEPFIRRFQKRIFVPLPDFSARLEMFRLYSQGLNLSDYIDFETLALLTEGYTGSDIRDIFQSVHIRVVREFFESGNPNDKKARPREITMSDFEEVLKRRRPSVSSEIMRSYKKWFESFKAT
ncbi:MAG: ATP-binding protein [Candidatus Bathyarchaeia archaeon]